MNTSTWHSAVLSLACAAAVLCAAPSGYTASCETPDNGHGTGVLPAPCPYNTENGTMNIVDGLAPGDELQSSASIDSFFDIFTEIGGALGGERETFSATLHLDMKGTGALGTYARTFVLPHVLEVHTSARTACDAIQTFDTDMFRLQGQLPPGDPDFDLLRITAGTGFGMPSPGHTTLSRLPSGGWAVDSFFDITYRIDFIGAPGGPLAGHSGSTTATIRIRQGDPIYVGEGCVTPTGATGVGTLPADCPLVSENGTMNIVDGLPSGTQLNSSVRIDSFFDIFTEIGGSLGGERETFSASLQLDMQGTGDLSTFKRVFVLPHVLEVHTSARTPGVAKEDLTTDLFLLQGQIIGDPDFDLLRITGGTGSGMPSPGHTTLTRLPSGNWAVDSFFDITYRIDFVGAPGGRLAGRSGSTTGTIRMHQGTPEPVSPPQCLQPDNGTGAPDLPAACPFTSPSGTMNIIDGLPSGTELNSSVHMDSFFDIFTEIGGSLGGERQTFSASLQFDMTGTGTLNTYARTFVLPHVLEIHTAPRTSGPPYTTFTFDTTIFMLQGQLPPGDPDFDLLRVTAGSNFGMPSPGHTTLTRQAGGSWAVDSFFDITYRIDFVGAPGSPLAGMSGSTTATIRMEQGGGFCATPAGGEVEEFEFPLNEGQETPPTGTRATGCGMAFFSVDGATLTVDVTHGVSSPTGAHIHVGAVGVPGGAILQSFASPESPIHETFAMTPADVTELLAGNLYVDIHSATYPNGAIRGQIVAGSPQCEVHTDEIPNDYSNGGMHTVGEDLCFSVPGPGHTFQWSFNGTPLTGETYRELCLSDIQESNSGVYTCDYDDGSKAPAQYIVYLMVGEGVPAIGMFGIALLTSACGLSAAWMLRRRKQQT